MLVAIFEVIGDAVLDDDVTTVAPFVLPKRLVTIEVGTEPALDAVV